MMEEVNWEDEANKRKDVPQEDAYLIDGKYYLATKPWTSGKCSTDENKSCWDCCFIRVGPYPNRHCTLDKDREIFLGDAKKEVEDKGSTLADNCGDFLERSTDDVGLLTEEDYEKVKKRMNQ